MTVGRAEVLGLKEGAREIVGDELAEGAADIVGAALTEGAKEGTATCSVREDARRDCLRIPS